MSRVKDLEIRGIRNFGDENTKARIHFSKPLTLIFGPNGTGKTTIIESLKYAISGEYPPDSDRGKAFVHEPKSSLCHTVEGQVEGKFVDKNGREFTVTREMQASRMRTGGLRFQALDSTMTRLDERSREKVQITSRCSDVDWEILNAMGVSKPILNYVIFCHQEESNWPLEDEEKLKDRFDEIFDLSQYEIAMYACTKLIKDLQSELNGLKDYEEGLKAIVEEVESQEEKLRESERREQEAKNRLNEIDELAMPVDQRMKEIISVQADYDKLEDRIKKIETDYVQPEVREFIRSKIDENLQLIEIKVEKTEKEYDVKQAEKSDLEAKINFLNEQCSSQETGKKDLVHNLELMNMQESFEDIKEQLPKYQQVLKSMQFDKLKKECQQLRDQKDKYEKERNEIRGEQGELENSIRTLKRNLNQEKYRMARRNHKEKQLQLVVQKEAIANLKFYAKILDKAMIQFHEERMNTVNKIMRQLWNLVYSGNDTSSIQIRVQTTEGIGDKNYKLVQVKRNIEMDMKRKCSAGQKVLASIIIRMALAETFCSDCAVLALDEPTTNLDEENAKNLAVTLSKVIQLRAQDHKNFQLIVISHDEKFISHLSNLSGKQMFQELYRNMDGYSEVRRRDMSEYTKNNSQSVNDDRYEYDTEDEEEDVKRPEPSISKTKKRILSLDDSPPPGRPAKRRANF